MTLGLQIVAGWMAFVALFGLALLAWAIYSGQLDDAEAIKYIPFNESGARGLARPPDGREGGLAVPDNVLQVGPQLFSVHRGD